MATQAERNWTAHIVVASNHAGLNPYFKMVENELYRVLARIDNPKEVVAYLVAVRNASDDWFRLAEPFLSRR